MLKWFNKNKEKKNKGFTLVELIIVVAILAILVGLLAPQYTKYVDKSRKSADVSNLEEMVKAFQVACADLETGVEDGTYVIDISTTGTTFQKGTTAVGDKDDLLTNMTATLGADWKKTRIKSKNWKVDENGTNHVQARCTVDNGAVSVTYEPTELKNSISDKETIKDADKDADKDSNVETTNP